MAGSPDADWLREMRRATVQPVVHCSIALDGTTMDFHNWSSGGLASTITGDPLLSSMTSMTQSVDPIARGLQISEIDLVLVDDGKIRGIVASQNFFNAVTTIKLGTPDLALSEFEIIFKGYVVRMNPSGGSINIKVRSLDSLVADKSNMRSHVNQHPFDVVERMLLDSGVASGDIDSTSFTLGTYSDDISHYCFSSVAALRDRSSEDFDTRGRLRPGLENIVYMMDYNYDAIDFRTFVNETMMLTRTTMFVNADGKVALKHFNSSTAAVKHFTTDEYGDFDQVEEDPLIFNKVNASFRNADTQAFVRKDATSVTAYGDEQLDADVLFLAPNAAYYESGSVLTAEPTVSGYAGTVNLTSSQSDEAPSSDRPVYWLHRQEVLKSTSAFTLYGPGSGNTSYVPNYDADGDAIGSLTTIPMNIRFNSPATRPFAGNLATEADRFVYDITATYDFSTYVLERFSNTAPKVKITTGLEFVYLELGDFVTLDNDLFLCPELALDGLDSSVKFEITGKEITAVGDSVGVVFTLIYATKTSPPSTSLASQLADKFATMMPDSILQAINIGLADNSVVNGLGLSIDSGLGGDVARGAASAGASALRTNPSPLAFTAIASKDNYIGVDLYTGQIIITAITTDDPEPPLLSGEVRLGVAVADGSGITSVSDLRQIGHVSADQINKEMIAPGVVLLWNPGFDIWANTAEAPSAWTVDSGAVGTDLERSTTQVHGGRYSTKVLNTSTIASLTSAKIPVDLSKPYRVAAWVYLGASFAVQLDVFWFKSNRAASSTASTSVYSASPGHSAWVNISGVASPPSDAAFASVRIRRSASPGNVGYFDDVSIKEEPVSFRALDPATTAGGAGIALAKDGVRDVFFTDESHDYGGVFNAANGRFTAPEAGTYELTYTVQVDCDTGAASTIIAYLLKNGANLCLAFGGVQTVSGYFASATVSSGPVELAKDDYITTQVFVGTRDSNLVIASDDSWFSGRKIS